MDVSIEDSRNKAQVTEHHIENTSYTKYPGNYSGYCDEWNLEQFKKNFRIQIVNYEKGKDLEIDLIGIGPAIANAYRRIIIAEVPTMAIEYCFIYNNTSVIQDEMLSHRFGMLPIRADPTKFEWRVDATLGPQNFNPRTSLDFRLAAKCLKKANVDPEKSGRRGDIYDNYKVLSGDIIWKPLAGQEEHFSGKDIIRPVHKKLLIAKLAENQEIDVRLHAVKGIGRDHAKFSPVATATFRLMPEIKILEKITGEAALRVKESFSKGVIEIHGRDKSAKVVNARIDSGSRNIFRYPDLKDKVKYELIKDHFIFNIESSGCMKAMDIFIQSTHILEHKCKSFLADLQAYKSGTNDAASMIGSEY